MTAVYSLSRMGCAYACDVRLTVCLTWPADMMLYHPQMLARSAAVEEAARKLDAQASGFRARLVQMAGTLKARESQVCGPPLLVAAHINGSVCYHWERWPFVCSACRYSCCGYALDQKVALMWRTAGCTTHEFHRVHCIT